MFSKVPQQFCQFLKHLLFLTQNISVFNLTVTNAIHMTGTAISYCFKVMLVAKTNTDDQNIRITSLSSVILPSGPGMNGGLYIGIGNTYIHVPA